MKKTFVLVIALLGELLLYSQDTNTIYFEFGSSKLSDENKCFIDSLSLCYDLKDIDSISFIGMADSVGRIKSNLRLSEKRSKKTAEYFTMSINDNLHINIFALGENLQGDENKNRRVDIIIYNKTIEIDTISADTIALENYCYEVDYHLINTLNIYSRTKRKKGYYTLESSKFTPNLDNKDFYYGKLDTNNQFTAVKIKWRTRHTGISWYGKTRSVAKVPKENFNKYKIFTIHSEPCSDCDQQYNETGKMLGIDSTMEVDYFIMSNFQYRYSVFKPFKAKIRVPKQYVNTNYTYYIGCNDAKIIKWKEKKRNKRYYHTTLPIVMGGLKNISRKMPNCASSPYHTRCDTILLKLGHPDRTPSLALTAEVALKYYNKEFYPIFEIGFDYEAEYLKLSLKTGIDKNISLLGAIKFDYTLIKATPFLFLPLTSWRNPYTKITSSLLHLNIGTDIYTVLNPKQSPQLLYTAYIGFRLTEAFNLINQMYFNFGPTTDILDPNHKIYFRALLGVEFNIFAKEIEPRYNQEEK